MSGVPSLNKIVRESAINAMIEGTGKSLYDIWDASTVLPAEGGLLFFIFLFLFYFYFYFIFIFIFIFFILLIFFLNRSDDHTFLMRFGIPVLKSQIFYNNDAYSAVYHSNYGFFIFILF